MYIAQFQVYQAECNHFMNFIKLKRWVNQESAEGTEYKF